MIENKGSTVFKVKFKVKSIVRFFQIIINSYNLLERQVTV